MVMGAGGGEGSSRWLIWLMETHGVRNGCIILMPLRAFAHGQGNSQVSRNRWTLPLWLKGALRCVPPGLR